jgi:23S rRNA U2552 (ribose-2'-O)-methylase RlmE/FtsJ
MKVAARFADIPPDPYICGGSYDRLNRTKEQIDTRPIKGKWDWAKRICNDLEAIHFMPNNRTGIAEKVPLSRAYFKLWEILHMFNRDLPKSDVPITSLHLAEGPGGFIECVSDYRGNKEDKMWGISLRSDSETVPNWRKARDFLEDHPEVKITYGADGTGDLLHICNLLWLSRNISSDGVDLITADGGFDFTEDFFNQEAIFFRLFFAEVLTAIMSQKNGGVFICKFFDFFTRPTIDLLYILSKCYNQVHIIKPQTSRPANAERYFVGIGFVKPPPHFINELVYSFVQSVNGKYYVSLLEKEPGEIFLGFIESKLEESVEQQIESLEENIRVIMNSKFRRLNMNEIIQRQVRKSMDWCRRNGINVNKEIVAKYI